MSDPTSQPSRRMFLRVLSLRKMLVLVAILGTLIGLWVRSYGRQRAAIGLLDRKFGTAVYDSEITGPGGRTTREVTRRFLDSQGKKHGQRVPPARPTTKQEWLTQWLQEHGGRDLVRSVVMVNAVNSDISDEDLALLSDLPKLERIYLGKTRVGDAGMAHLKEMRQLKALYVYETQVTDAGLLQLKDLDQLEELGLSRNPGITNAGMKHLKELKRLRILEIGGTSVTDDGLDELEGLTNLECLYASTLPITNAGLGKLKGMKSLKSLFVAGTRVTPQGLDQLRNALPDLKIEFR